MAGYFKVTGPAVVVRVGGAERYLYRGARLPAGVTPADAARLIRRGLVTEVVAATAPEPEDTSGEGPQEPEDTSGEGEESKPARGRRGGRAPQGDAEQD